MTAQKRRAVDSMEFGRDTDEIWNSEAEIGSHKMIYAMFRSQIELNKRLTDHMENEEVERKVINNKLSEITDSIKPLIDSMPRDAQGNPSPFIHRLHHETGTAVYKSGIVQEALKLLFIGIVVLASTGNLGALITHLLG